MKRAVEIIDRKKAEKEAAAQAKREEVSLFLYRIAVCLYESSEPGSLHAHLSPEPGSSAPELPFVSRNLYTNWIIRDGD